MMTELDRRSILPLWQQIRDVLAAEIRAGTLGADGKLPPAGQLAQRFGVNRHTVRQSLMALEDIGMTQTRQGSGSYVVGRVVNYPISQRTRFSEIVLKQGMAPSGEVLRDTEKAATKEVADALALRRNTRVLMIERSSRADGVLVGISRHYFPAARFRKLGPIVRQTFSISEAFRRVGVENYYRRSTTVSARLPTSREARLLNQPASRPVLVSKAVNVDDRDKPVEFGVTLFLADRVRLQFGD
jgi:GntR family phosphonate transport system transcriptional regulator